MTAVTATTGRTSSRLTPGNVALLSLAWGLVCMIAINLLTNRPHHDNIASIDAMVGTVIVVTAVAVYVVMRLVWANPARSATAALVLGIVTIVSLVMWWSLAPAVFGIGAFALALHARNESVRSAKCTVAFVLGSIGIAVSVVFVIGSVVSFLTS